MSILTYYYVHSRIQTNDCNANLLEFAVEKYELIQTGLLAQANNYVVLISLVRSTVVKLCIIYLYTYKLSSK